MSTRLLRKRRDPLELIERMINTTSLQTKQVHHRHIFGIGDKAIEEIDKQTQLEKELAVKHAIASCEARAIRELRAALKRLRNELQQEKQIALNDQKKYYEDMAEKVAAARDKAEEERIRQLLLKCQKEKEDALRKQWEDCEIIKAKAIEDACNELRIQLRKEFIMEKEKAIADALKIAREKYKIREKLSIEKTRQECEKLAAEEAVRVAKLHHAELHRRDNLYKFLQHKFENQIILKDRVEKEFKELQDDYRRFMDYTFKGVYHSDFMISFRTHGMEGKNKTVSQRTLEETTEF